jgi:hypothetical protein
MISQAEGDSDWRSSEGPVDEARHLKASSHEWHVPDQARANSPGLPDWSPLHIALT